MFRAFSFSFLSFLHINYKPVKGKKSTLNAKNFYTITLPNYSRSFRCQIQTLSARPKFAGQNGAANPETRSLRGATNPGSGPHMELRIRPGNCYGAAFWELEIVNFFIFRLARNQKKVL